MLELTDGSAQNPEALALKQISRSSGWAVNSNPETFVVKIADDTEETPTRTRNIGSLIYVQNIDRTIVHRLASTVTFSKSSPISLRQISRFHKYKNAESSDLQLSRHDGATSDL